MKSLINKYITIYHHVPGTSLDKIKSIVMNHTKDWGWQGAESAIADILDDRNITPDDIVDFLSNSYEYYGGNEEFHCAIRAMEVLLRRAKLELLKSRSFNEIELFRLI